LSILKAIPPFILGSGSPRRRELLRDAGFNFDIIKVDVDETIPEKLTPIEAVDYLSMKKLVACKEYCKENLVLTADTLVFLEDKILGKPNNRDEAISMLELLSGKTHQVITSVCLGYQENQFQYNVSTAVTFAILDRNIISYYIDHYQPFDKAGSYGIQEWIGEIGIPRIEGSFTNVVGLPMHETYHAIVKYSKQWITE
jgi:septum formation protein